MELSNEGKLRDELGILLFEIKEWQQNWKAEFRIRDKGYNKLVNEADSVAFKLMNIQNNFNYSYLVGRSFK